MLNDQILESSKQIDDLANDIEQEISTLFDKCIEKSKIDEQLNNEWSSNLNRKIKNNQRLKHSKISWRVWMWLCFAISLGLIIYVLIATLANHNKVEWYIFFATSFLIVLTIFLFVFGYKAIKKIDTNIESNNNEIIDLQNKIQKQLLPLVNAFSYHKIFDLISSKWKNISFNQSFTTDKQLQMIDVFNTLHNNQSLSEENLPISYWKSKSKNFYDLPKVQNRHWYTNFNQKIYIAQLNRNNVNLNNYTNGCSFLNLLSGQLHNHPFIFYNCLLQEWVIQIYTGSKAVSGDGKKVVTATFPWPKPIWKKTNETFAFKSNIAPNLSFLPTNLKRKLFEKIIIIDPIKNMPMENKSFDKVFQTVRNNELGYRTIFSPLAQENLVNLFDKFVFEIKKDKTITYTSLPKNDNQTIKFNALSCFKYDISEFKSNLINTIKQFVIKLGYCQLPFANIPAYCQEYDLDLKNSTSRNNCPSESEIEALINANNLFGLQGQTPTIINIEMIKQTIINKYSVSLAKVYGSSFTMVNKVKIVFTSGTSVPVNYIDYIPAKKTCFVAAINVNKPILDKIVHEELIVEHGVICCKFSHCPSNDEVKTIIQNVIKDSVVD